MCIFIKRKDMLEEFKKEANQCIEALDKLLQSEYICKSDKHLMRINRFKRWVLETIKNATPTSINN